MRIRMIVPECRATCDTLACTEVSVGNLGIGVRWRAPENLVGGRIAYEIEACIVFGGYVDAD
jgi:hypothetical protein